MPTAASAWCMGSDKAFVEGLISKSACACAIRE
jgi:hypothetical protein